ncbi:uncharacterized protein LOC124446058 [Xenia sp. Carnegie-2017]|uniref:uncharacterized protein LOC124446058 n=1 Tax=Xenia sp. Carnegie-2017 TaxID=2897299 RepID=UPI001F04BF3B|nr:uncharacterized protein LOC124446058 [Xenia sp. Carnegie-2017]
MFSLVEIRTMFTYISDSFNMKRLFYVLIIMQVISTRSTFAVKSEPQNELQILDYINNKFQWDRFKRSFSQVEDCLNGLWKASKNPQPCLYSCRKRIWIEKNITEVLRKTRDVREHEKVREEQEIMIVPWCTCNHCPRTRSRRYKFTLINTSTGKITRIMSHNIKYCLKCT